MQLQLLNAWGRADNNAAAGFSNQQWPQCIPLHRTANEPYIDFNLISRTLTSPSLSLSLCLCILVYVYVVHGFGVRCKKVPPHIRALLIIHN